MKEKQDQTILDRCKAIGEAFYIASFGESLEEAVKAIVVNYGSDNFDRVTFLSDVANSLDYCDGIAAAASDIASTLRAMRAEVSQIFNEEDEQ